MSEVAIRCEVLGKRYRIGRREVYKTLSGALTETLYAPFRMVASGLAGLRRGRPPGDDTIWALKHVSFEVERGEVVGIIGRNGAGKSTLLKILSRITEPTAGRAEVRGQVASLLEVGTGFHPELTGRENVFLNGAILGMKKSEINRKFDQIIDFAEVTRFVDTALKHYSSGMYLRLAFSVAAHLDSDVLLVDEVLAVGDLSFQQRCLGKMSEVAKRGRTVLLVTHQMNQIRRLSDKCLWLDASELRASGSPAAVVTAYESSFAKSDPRENHVGRTVFKARFDGWRIVKPEPNAPNVLDWLGEVTFEFQVRLNEPLRKVLHGVALRDGENQVICAWAFYDLDLAAPVTRLLLTLPSLPLRPGAYHWFLSLHDDHGVVDMWDQVIPPLVIATPPQTHPQDRWQGVLNLPAKLRTDFS